MKNFLKVTACLFMLKHDQSFADSHPVHFMRLQFHGRQMIGWRMMKQSANDAMGDS